MWQDSPRPITHFVPLILRSLPFAPRAPACSAAINFSQPHPGDQFAARRPLIEIRVDRLRVHLHDVLMFQPRHGAAFAPRLAGVQRHRAGRATAAAPGTHGQKAPRPAAAPA